MNRQSQDSPCGARESLTARAPAFDSDERSEFHGSMSWIDPSLTLIRCAADLHSQIMTPGQMIRQWFAWGIRNFRPQWRLKKIILTGRSDAVQDRFSCPTARTIRIWLLGSRGSWGVLAGAGAIVMFAGCTTPATKHPAQRPLVQGEEATIPVPVAEPPLPTKTPLHSPEDKAASSREAPIRGEASVQNDGLARSAGEFTILVESQPTGAMIVVNGIPVGRAPRKITLSGTPQGFSRETVSIKARFVASSRDEQSITIEEELTPLDRLPVILHFTPEKAQRRW